MSKLVRIVAPHAFVNGSLVYEGAVVSVPDDTEGDWFVPYDPDEPAPDAAPEAKPEPMSFSQLRAAEASTDFITGMKKMFKLPKAAR